jgi:hypothetical protein
LVAFIGVKKNLKDIFMKFNAIEAIKEDGGAKETFGTFNWN